MILYYAIKFLRSDGFEQGRSDDGKQFFKSSLRLSLSFNKQMLFTVFNILPDSNF